MVRQLVAQLIAESITDIFVLDKFSHGTQFVWLHDWLQQFHSQPAAPPFVHILQLFAESTKRNSVHSEGHPVTTELVAEAIVDQQGDPLRQGSSQLGGGRAQPRVLPGSLTACVLGCWSSGFFLFGPPSSRFLVARLPEQSLSSLLISSPH